MATYVIRDPSGAVAHRHLRATCRRLVEAARVQGRQVGDFWGPNTKARGRDDAATRCPDCFYEGEPLEYARGYRPDWVVAARDAPAARNGSFGFVYEVFDPIGRASLIGSTRDLTRRIEAHWRAVKKGRAIPWLYDRLQDEPGWQADWRFTRVPVEELKHAEDRIRDTRRSEGWEVATDF